MIEKNETILIEPNRENFPHIDYIIFDPLTNLVIFKQITMQTIEEHIKEKLDNIPENYKYFPELYKFLIKKSYKWKIENENEVLYQPKKEDIIPDKSLAEGLLEMIFGEKGFKSEIINNEINFKNPKGEIMNNVFILYGSGKSKGENKNIPKIKNLRYYTKEEMESIGIIF